MKNNHEVLLSISILMSGRKETRQCLESLVPIMEQVPSELILVDTGCDEETRKILEEYTDIIIPFEWCDDFSKARNVGLERATGKWLMFLDDDEWFVDTTEIIDFFNSGEYKKYKSACYKVRNYTRLDESDYTDNYASRMTEIFENTSFKYSIHEGLSPLLEPVKLFDTYVKHFGYVYATKEDMYKDSNRNLNLLKKELKNNPNDLRMSVLIIQEYRRLKEFDNIIEYSLECIDKINKDSYIYKDFEWKLCAFYCYVLDAYEKKQDYKEVLKYLDKIKDDTRVNELTRAFLNKSELTASYKLENFEQAFYAFENYLRLYEKFVNNQEILYSQGKGLNDGIFRDNVYKYVISTGIIVALKLGKEDILEKYFDKLEWNDADVMVNPSFAKDLMVYILDNEYKEKYVYYISKMLENNICLQSIVNYVSSIENSNSATDSKDDDNTIDIELKEIDEERKLKFERGIKLLSQVDNTHWYFTYASIINADREENSAILFNLYNKLFEKVEDIFNLDDCIWKIAEKHQLDMSILINNIDYDKWRRGVDNWVKTSDKNSIETRIDYVNRWNIKDSIRLEYFYMNAKEGLLLKLDKGDCNFEQLEKEIFDYANLVKNYYSGIYKAEIFNQMFYILPKQCRFAMEMLDIIEMKNVNGKEALERLKNMASIYVHYVDVINTYSKLLGEMIITKSKEAKKASEEIFELAIILKIKAREYIENGNIEQAKVILQNVIQNVPNDKEAKEILSMIE